MVLLVTYLLLAALYLCQYYGQGLSLATGFFILWERWLVLAVVALLYGYLLSYTLTQESASPQSFFFIVFYTLVYLGIFAATVFVSQRAKVVAIGTTIVLFMLTFICFIFPVNRLTDRRADFPPYGENRINSLRVVLFFVILLVLAVYLIVWALSASNGFTTQIGLQGEVIAYLVLDALLTMPLTLLVFIFTLSGQLMQVKITDTATNTVEYKAPYKKPALLSVHKNK